MKRSSPLLLAVAALCAGCADDPDPWIATGALASDATLGAMSEVAAFAAPLGAECAVSAAPAVEIVTQGALGVASVGTGSRTISDKDDPCDGTVVATTAVRYQGDKVGIDTLVLRERKGSALPDVIHTAHIRVR